MVPEFGDTEHIRRYPTGMGGACYHITDWIPELVEPSLKLFRNVGLRGLANIEFKQDERRFDAGLGDDAQYDGGAHNLGAELLRRLGSKLERIGGHRRAADRARR